MKRVLLASVALHAALIASAAAVRVRMRNAPVESDRVEFEFMGESPRPPPSRPVMTRAAVVRLPPPPNPSRVEAVHGTPRTQRAAGPAMRSARMVGPADTATPFRVAEVTVPATAPTPTTAISMPETGTTTPRIDVAGLFQDARSAAVTNEAATAPPQHGSTEDLNQRARTATQGYVNEMLANASRVEPPQVHAYYGALSRRMRETWRPGFYRTPTMVDALLAVPRRMANVAARYSNRASTFALTGRPDDPARPLIVTDFEDRAGFSTVTTSTIVEVEQDETGRLLSVRVVRPARVRDFDEAAIAAVRAAIPQQETVPLPGGRRSRWAFDVVASRDAIVPIAGFTFNESNGFFEMNYPGALHVRTRVRPVGSRPLAVPWPAPNSTTAR